MTAEEQRVVARVKSELERLYGARLRRVILYGSRARGDARADSDYDILAVLDEIGDYWSERQRLGDLWQRLLFDTNAYVSLRAATADELGQQTLFMHNVRGEGVAV